MKSIFRILSLGIIASFLFSCSPSLKVTTDFDRSANFDSYRTFGIFSLPDEGRNISPLNRDRIIAAIRSTLIEKGFTESNNPDFWVNPILVIQITQQHSSTTTGFGGVGMMGMGMGGFHRPYGWGGGMMMGGPMISTTQHHVENIKDGSLILDIIDARTNSLVWNGVGEREINKKFKKNAEEKINKYMRQLLSEFPPEPITHTTKRVSDLN